MAKQLGSIEVRNLNAVLRDVDKYTEEVKQKVSYELQASCLTIVANAKRNAAKNFGLLAQSITYVKKDQLHFEIVVAANYAAYMEFGTKNRVIIPGGFEDVAAASKGTSISTGGKTLKQSIFLWAEQKGIDKKLQFAIYYDILHNGIWPHPFLIPAYIAETKQLVPRLKNILNAR